jgi:hypothetical protein
MGDNLDVVKKISMQETLTVSELDDRIAVLRDNIRQLVEQASALSGTGDDDRTSERIAQQSADLEHLLERREALRRQ